MCEHQMFTLFMSCVCSENCAKCFRNLGAWSAQFRNEIWGGSLRNSGTGQVAPSCRFRSVPVIFLITRSPHTQLTTHATVFL